MLLKKCSGWWMVLGDQEGSYASDFGVENYDLRLLPIFWMLTVIPSSRLGPNRTCNLIRKSEILSSASENW